MRLIDESVALKKLNYILKTYRMDSIAEKMRDALKRCPTIDPASLRPKGEWEVDKFGIWRCPNCRHSIYDEEHLSSFCPNCGADMRKEATPNE